jgi:AAA domain
VRQEDDRPIGRSNAVMAGQGRLVPWIWEGVVAAGAVTLLSAPEKVGKTTLLSLLLDRRRAGGELLGRAVHPGKTVLCSEENDALWALRQPPLDFGPDLLFHSPVGDRPSRGRWIRGHRDRDGPPARLGPDAAPQLHRRRPPPGHA